MKDELLSRFKRCMNQNRVDAAFDICNEAISEDASDWNAIYLAGMTLRLRGDYVGAVDYYRRALDLNSKETSIWGALGIALQLLGRFSEAIDALTTAINIDNDNYAAHNSLGLTHKLAGDYTLAMRAYEDTLQICANRALRKVHQEHPELFPSKFPVRIVDRRWEKFTRQILETDLDYFNTVKNMATCCFEMDNPDKARDLQEHADTCTPFDMHLVGPFHPDRSDGELMSPNEIHNFGIEVVIKQFQKDGYMLESANTQLGQNPQIIAKKDSHIIFVFVRTDCYPKKGEMDGLAQFQCIEHAARHGALPYFASVGICNADGKTETDMRIPVKGAPYHIAYDGMILMSQPDRVFLKGDDGKSSKKH